MKFSGIDYGTSLILVVLFRSGGNGVVLSMGVVW